MTGGNGRCIHLVLDVFFNSVPLQVCLHHRGREHTHAGESRFSCNLTQTIVPKEGFVCFTNDNGETDTIPGTLRYFATIGERFVAM